jgi:hypothetical protein
LELERRHDTQHYDTYHNDTKYIVLSVIYDECHLCCVANEPILLIVIMLNAVALIELPLRGDVSNLIADLDFPGNFD